MKLWSLVCLHHGIIIWKHQRIWLGKKCFVWFHLCGHNYSRSSIWVNVCVLVTECGVVTYNGKFSQSVFSAKVINHWHNLITSFSTTISLSNLELLGSFSNISSTNKENLRHIREISLPNKSYFAKFRR